MQFVHTMQFVQHPMPQRLGMTAMVPQNNMMVQQHRQHAPAPWPQNPRPPGIEAPISPPMFPMQLSPVPVSPPRPQNQPKQQQQQQQQKHANPVSAQQQQQQQQYLSQQHQPKTQQRAPSRSSLPMSHQPENTQTPAAESKVGRKASGMRAQLASLSNSPRNQGAGDDLVVLPPSKPGLARGREGNRKGSRKVVKDLGCLQKGILSCFFGGSRLHDTDDDDAAQREIACLKGQVLELEEEVRKLSTLVEEKEKENCVSHVDGGEVVGGDRAGREGWRESAAAPDDMSSERWVARSEVDAMVARAVKEALESRGLTYNGNLGNEDASPIAARLRSDVTPRVMAVARCPECRYQGTTERAHEAGPHHETSCPRYSLTDNSYDKGEAASSCLSTPEGPSRKSLVNTRVRANTIVAQDIMSPFSAGESVLCEGESLPPRVNSSCNCVDGEELYEDDGVEYTVIPDLQADTLSPSDALLGPGPDARGRKSESDALVMNRSAPSHAHTRAYSQSPARTARPVEPAAPHTPQAHAPTTSKNTTNDAAHTPNHPVHKTPDTNNSKTKGKTPSEVGTTPSATPHRSKGAPQAVASPSPPPPPRSTTLAQRMLGFCAESSPKPYQIAPSDKLLGQARRDATPDTVGREHLETPALSDTPLVPSYSEDALEPLFTQEDLQSVMEEAQRLAELDAAEAAQRDMMMGYYPAHGQGAAYQHPQQGVYLVEQQGWVTPQQGYPASGQPPPYGLVAGVAIIQPQRWSLPPQAPAQQAQGQAAPPLMQQQQHSQRNPHAVQSILMTLACASSGNPSGQPQQQVYMSPAVTYGSGQNGAMGVAPAVLVPLDQHMGLPDGRVSDVGVKKPGDLQQWVRPFEIQMEDDGAGLIA